MAEKTPEELEEELTKLRKMIDFHESALKSYVHLLSPAAQYLETQTVKALQELLEIKAR